MDEDNSLASVWFCQISDGIHFKHGAFSVLETGIHRPASKSLSRQNGLDLLTTASTSQVLELQAFSTTLLAQGARGGKVLCPQSLSQS